MQSIIPQPPQGLSTEDLAIWYRKEIERANEVIRDASASPGFKVIMEDLGEMIKEIDKNWHLVATEKANLLQEMRVTKLAVTYLISIVQTYERNLKKYNEELFRLENPNDAIKRDYDEE